MHIAKSLKMPTHRQKLVKEYGCPTHGQTVENKARKPNNGSYAICLPQAQHKHKAYSRAVVAHKYITVIKD